MITRQIICTSDVQTEHLTDRWTIHVELFDIEQSGMLPQTFEFPSDVLQKISFENRLICLHILIYYTKQSPECLLIVRKDVYLLISCQTDIHIDHLMQFFSSHTDLQTNSMSALRQIFIQIIWCLFFSTHTDRSGEQFVLNFLMFDRPFSDL